MEIKLYFTKYAYLVKSESAGPTHLPPKTLTSYVNTLLHMLIFFTND